MAAKVALWREVEAGTRYTVKTAMERHPCLNQNSFKGLPSEVARQPKIGPGASGRARDVKTYLASEVDALVARLAAPEPEPVDPLWAEVEAGTRYTVKTAMERHTSLTENSCRGLPFEIARQPKRPGYGGGARDVKTYAAADVDDLAARLAAPQSVDPCWCEVESGARYTRVTAMKRYPQLYVQLFADLPFEIARRPNPGNGKGRVYDVKTFLAADVEALVARLAEPDPEPVDPRWREVETGARLTAKTAMKRYPQLSKRSFVDLPFEIVRRPKGKVGTQGACDIKTSTPEFGMPNQLVAAGASQPKRFDTAPKKSGSGDGGGAAGASVRGGAASTSMAASRGASGAAGSVAARSSTSIGAAAGVAAARGASGAGASATRARVASAPGGADGRMAFSSALMRLSPKSASV